MMMLALMPAFSALAQYRNDVGYQELEDSENVASMKSLVRYLSSSMLEGRKAGSEGEKLAAEYVDGTIIKGESNIPEEHKQIKRLFTEPAHCQALPEVLEAIAHADLIILGPGSLYTSVIPNLLVEDITDAIAKSTAKKIYVCNIMTQPGETDNYSVASHVNALLSHAKGKKIIDAVLVNNSLPDNISEVYAKSGSIPVRLDMENIAPIGVEIVSQKLIQENKQGLVRHSSNRVARAVYYWYRKTVSKKSEIK